MSAQIIDGKAVSAKIRGGLKAQAQELINNGIIPGLATIRVGEDPASKLYLKLKHKACSEVGVYSEDHVLAEDTGEKEVIAQIKKINQDANIHGILLQLPLPKPLDSRDILAEIDPRKDVDGITPTNLGRLVNGSKGFIPATPKGVLRLLDEYGIELEAKKATVIGRSVIVGKPLYLLLLSRNATVTMCHSRTRDVTEHTKDADILVSAVGSPGLVTADMVKEGGVVVDVGTTKTESGLAGDVDFEHVKEKAAYITPVPGGVGPMTISMLVENTVLAAQNSAGF
ncbi:MAG: bifunctional methylenetetrahydrofolate dehydrogenase/methenyltetrahydrofolate cyclohydrolase FolD [Candidatus Altiarchaeales archaeon]|nr:bifunctional methylenetetrahydrofolate dehydrogenase/methenyltetrahydrofolate cyclohydrolase FolD [Candidatus Altiarchaeales archaeon]